MVLSKKQRMLRASGAHENFAQIQLGASQSSWDQSLRWLPTFQKSTGEEEKKKEKKKKPDTDLVLVQPQLVGDVQAPRVGMSSVSHTQ